MAIILRNPVPGGGTKFDQFYEILCEAWSAETAQGEWSKENPALNQSAVSALAFQAFFGGELVRCITRNGHSHYWNRLGDNDYDLTSSQFIFSGDHPLRESQVIRERSYVLSFPNTVRRFGLLLQNMARVMETKKAESPQAS